LRSTVLPGYLKNSLEGRPVWGRLGIIPIRRGGLTYEAKLISMAILKREVFFKDGGFITRSGRYCTNLGPVSVFERKTANDGALLKPH